MIATSTIPDADIPIVDIILAFSDFENKKKQEEKEERSRRHTYGKWKTGDLS